MTLAATFTRPTYGAPPRIDESKLSKPLQDLFASWHESLKEPFRGITADGNVAQNLFPLRRTGLPTQQIVDAGNAFFASLDRAQQDAASFPIDSEVWRHWSNIHRNLMRHGLCLADLGDEQRERVYALLEVSVGPHAYATARNSMRLNTTLAEMTDLPEEFGEFFYWISIFGVPSATGPWGWQ